MRTHLERAWRPQGALPAPVAPVALLALVALVALTGCEPDDAAEPYPWAEPDAWGSTSGPGGPAASFADDALMQHCAYPTGGEQDVDHHNLVVMHDGWMVLPWAPEWGGGGLSFFDVSDPCDPIKVGEGYAEGMRESHTLSTSEIDGRTYAAVDFHGGIDEDGDGEQEEVWGGVGFWDITDVGSPQWIGELALPGYDYPDAYLFVTLSTFWQGPYVYVSGALNGVYIVDASDPSAPELVGQFTFEPNLLVGTFHVIGNLAMASAAGLAGVVMTDVSDPLNPVQVPGGDFLLRDGLFEEALFYFSNVGGRYGLFARKDAGGGPVVYDISASPRPSYVGDHYTEDGSGGYVARHEDRLFVGDSDFGSLYDFSDPENLVELGRFQLQGDLDTVMPLGNVALVAVDDDAVPGQGTAVVPWAAEPDRRGPRIELHSPEAGATFQALTSRVGLSFDEMVEGRSVFPGSFRVADGQGQAVPGSFNTQETIVNFTPDTPLQADTTYTVTVPTGGIIDISGNAIENELSFRFSTGAALAELAE